MTQQEQFEADYLAAFPDDVGKQCLFCKLPGGAHIYTRVEGAFGIWLQQAKRHEAELTAASTTIDNIEAALGDARDPNLSLYENVLKLREEIARRDENSRKDLPLLEAMASIAAEHGITSTAILARVEEIERLRKADHVATVINNNQPGKQVIVEMVREFETLSVGTKLYSGPELRAKAEVRAAPVAKVTSVYDVHVTAIMKSGAQLLPGDELYTDSDVLQGMPAQAVSVPAVFSCPIGAADCHRNCGNYGCGN